MSRSILWLLVLQIVWAGCSSSQSNDPVPASNESATHPEPSADDNIADATNRQLTELLQQVGEQETAQSYTAAVGTWQLIREKLESIHGQHHWQLINCDQAIATNRTLASMTSAERTQFDRLRELDADAERHNKTGAVRLALKTVQEAYPLAVDLFGDQSAMALNLQQKIAQFHLRLDELDEAYATFAQFVQVANSQYQVAHPEVETAVFHLGLIERQRGNPADAVVFLAESLRMAGELYGTEDTVYAKRLNDLGVAYHRAGELEQALATLNQATRIRQSAGVSAALIAESTLNEGIVLTDLGQHTEARERFNTIIELAQSSPDADAFRLEALSGLATLCTLDKEFAAAADHLQQALDQVESLAGKHCPKYAELAYRKAANLCFQGNWSDAETLFQHALQVQSNLFGTQDSITRKTASTLVQVLQRLQRADEAASLARMYNVSPGGTNTVNR